MTIKYNDNDYYSSPVALNDGTVAQKRGVIVCQIFAIAHVLFNITNHPLNPFARAKINRFRALVIKKAPIAVATGAQRVAAGHPLQNSCH